VHAEDAIGDDCGDGKEVERIRDDLPCLDGQSSFAFVVKSIEFVELAGLVVSPQQEEVAWVSDFKSHEEADTLQ
jgi:hypothetical protein